MTEDKHEKPRRYVIHYYADYGGAVSAAAHVWAYSVLDATLQFELSRKSGGRSPRYGGARDVEPYRQEVHGPWAQATMSDKDRAEKSVFLHSREAYGW
jgi:hypothetical protein